MLTSTLGAREEGAEDALSLLRQLLSISPRVAVDALVESEEGQRLLAEVMPTIAWTMSAAGEPTYANRRWYQYVGWDEETPLTLERLNAQIHPEDLPRVQRLFGQSLKTNRPFECEMRIRGRDGEYRWFAARALPQLDAKGEVLHWCGTTSDIHDKKLALAQAAATDERLQLAVVGANDGVWDWRTSEQTFYWSPRCYEMLGYEPDEFVTDTQTFHALVHPDDLERVQEAIGRYDRQETPDFRVEFRLRHKNGTYRWILSRGIGVRDETGRVVRFVGSHTDVTERRRVEESLRESENYLRDLIASLPGIVWTATPDGACDYLSPQWYEFTGSPIGGDLGESWTRPLHPEDQQRAWVAWRHAVADRAVYDVEYRLRRHDGAYRWFKVRGRPVRDNHGQIVRWFGTCTDIDSQRRTAERLGLLSDISSQLLVAEDPQSIVESLCHAVMRHLDCEVFFNYLLDDAKGALHLNASAGLPEETRRAWEWFEVGKPVCGMVAEDGCRRVYAAIQTSEMPATDALRGLGLNAYCCHPLVSQGRVIGTLGFGLRSRSRFMEDEVSLMQAVTDHVAMGLQRMTLLNEARRKKEEAETASQAKDHFLATLSHELRTPLNPVMLVTSSLMKRRDLPAEVMQDLEVIRTSVQLEARLVDDLLDLTRITRGKIDLQLQPVSVHQVVRYTIDACAAELPTEKKPIIHAELTALEDTVMADPARLSQVLWNLLRNAVKFTPATGTITVHTRDWGDQISIDVSDTGVGIDQTVLPKIFDAFEQGTPEVTRQFGGLGLGLTIAQALVKLHGGTIGAASEGRGMGATFTIQLPLYRHSPAAAGAMVANDASEGTARVVTRILLVEDHMATAGVLKRILQGEGYEVLHTDTVKGALAMIEKEHLDLVISDIGLPDGTGRDLLPLLLEKQVPAIAVSGFGMESDLALSRKAGFVAHLVKPITVDMLLRALKQVR